MSALEILGLNKKFFGLHSLRSGGATAAAAAKVDDKFFKKHGRWKTDKAKDGYVKQTFRKDCQLLKILVFKLLSLFCRTCCTLVNCSYESVVYFIYELI